MFNLATALVTTSNSSSNKTDCGGKSTDSSRLALASSPSSEEDNTSAEPFLGVEENNSERAFVPKKWALDLAGEEEEKDVPVSILTARSSCDPHNLRHRYTSVEAGPEPWGNAV